MKINRNIKNPAVAIALQAAGHDGATVTTTKVGGNKQCAKHRLFATILAAIARLFLPASDTANGFNVSVQPNATRQHGPLRFARAAVAVIFFGLAIASASAASDLVVSGSVSTSPNPVTSGNNLTVTLTIHNQGASAATASTTRVQIKNAALTATIADQNFSTPAIAAGGSTTQTYTVAIPTGTTPGSYNVYIVLDRYGTAGQGSNTGNDYATSPAFNIVAPVLYSDLIVSGTVSTSPNPVTSGNNLTVTLTIFNQGAGAAAASTTRVQIKNASLTATIADQNFSTPAIAAAGFTTQTYTVAIPAGTTPGSYNTYIVLDRYGTAGQGGNTGNDYATSPAFNIVAPVQYSDLVVSGTVSTSPNPVTAGNNLTVTFTIYNQGAGAAAASTSRVQIKNAALATIADQSFSTPAIAAGGSTTPTYTILIPAGTTPATCNVYVTLDQYSTAGQGGNTANDYATSPAFNVVAPVQYSDLVVSGTVSTSPNPVTSGNSLTVTLTIYNQGAGAAAASTTHVQIKNAALATIADQSFSTPAIAAGGSTTPTYTVLIPAGTLPATCNAYITLDQYSTAGQGGNTANDYATSPAFNIVAPVQNSDLVVSGPVSISPNPVTAGNNLNVMLTISNQGPGAAAASTTRVQIKNAALTATIADQDNSTPAIAAVGSTTQTYTVAIPAGTPPGSYNAYIVLDRYGTAGQGGNTANDYATSPVFSVQSAPAQTVSAVLSSVTATPSSAPADGISAITIKVTLKDLNGNPVSGRLVNIYAGTLPITITGAASQTDANGNAIATATSTAPCAGNIFAVDRTDVILLQQEAPIQFTQQALVSVGASLNNTINLLNSASANTLNGISGIALDEGAVGDDFRAQMNSDEAKSIANIGFFALGALVPDPAGLSAQISSKLGINMAGLMTGDILSAIFSNPHGLSNGGSVIATACLNDVQTLQGQVAALQAGVPQSSLNNSAGYNNEVSNRLAANAVLFNVLQRQDAYLKILDGAAQSSQNGLVPETLKIASYVGGGLDVASVIPALTPVALPSALIFNSALAAANSLQLWQAYDANQNAYFKTFSSLSTCWDVAGTVNANAISALSEIAQGSIPNILTGSIVSADTTETCYQVGQLPGSWQVAGSTPASTIGFITNCYSLVTVQNTSATNAQYVVFASFDYQNSVFGFSTNMPLVSWTATNLMAGQTAQVVLNYFDGNNGAPPAAESVIPISVLAISPSGTYFVGSFNSVVTPQVTGTGLLDAVSHSQGMKAGATPNDASSSNNIVVIENPIKCVVVYNQSNQTYQATILVANPFLSALDAVVNQPLPAGLNVLNASGVVQNGAVTWTNSISAGGVASDTFTFGISAIPGGSTNLPTPSLTFMEPNTTNSLMAQPVAPSFQAAIPLQVTANVPAGVVGTDTPMFVTVTNMSASSESGTLIISLVDNYGMLVTNYSQSVIVQGLGGTNLTFVLSGILAPGSYSLTGTLNLNGGASQVLASTFTVTPPPLTLGFASPTPWSTNGLNLVLHGSPGSNYVIVGTSDLSNTTNWQPILYFTATNATFQFVDPTATNYNHRFYRALQN